ncbi:MULTISPECIES: inorganic diphosphatase [Anoxybacillaceae]|uniref:inorganic diphosphatase n=1 Tax=Anoxybacillaceae TaxID=3120669 RepID=UPI00351B6FEB
MAEMENVVEVTIEVPRGEQNKYEFDESTGKIKLDRVLFSPMFYPCDYGHIENTLALDGDPLDVLVLTTNPTFPGCVIDTRIVGALIMSDDKGQDEKLIGVPLSDPRWENVHSLKDVNPHTLREIKHFFERYKELENKETTIIGWEGRDVALKLIKSCQDRFKKYTVAE